MTATEGPELHEGIRLQKVLAQAGVASRRAAARVGATTSARAVNVSMMTHSAAAKSISPIDQDTHQISAPVSQAFKP